MKSLAAFVVTAICLFGSTAATVRRGKERVRTYVGNDVVSLRMTAFDMYMPGLALRFVNPMGWFWWWVGLFGCLDLVVVFLWEGGHHVFG